MINGYSTGRATTRSSSTSFGDYRNNVKLYPAFQESFREHQFPSLITWGKNDPIFTVEEAEAFKRDLPNAEVHYLDAGHFALETDAAAIAGYIREFMPRGLQARR
jgi:pimeloyl-ACP methyl ester carboxylesterase